MYQRVSILVLMEESQRVERDTLLKNRYDWVSILVLMEESQRVRDPYQKQYGGSMFQSLF